MKLTCVFVDVCHPDYWGGHHLPHVAVPVYREMAFITLRESILDELRAGAVAGADATPEETYENEEWYEAAREAVERDVRPTDPSIDRPFCYLDNSGEDDDEEFPYAYFVFARFDRAGD